MKAKCKSCIFWRGKGWSGDIGIGICDNPKVIAQVTLLSEAVIERFVVGDSEKEKKQNAAIIANSMRFRSDFGCLHYEKNI